MAKQFRKSKETASLPEGASRCGNPDCNTVAIPESLAKAQPDFPLLLKHSANTFSDDIIHFCTDCMICGICKKPLQTRDYLLHRREFGVCVAKKEKTRGTFETWFYVHAACCKCSYCGTEIEVRFGTSQIIDGRIAVMHLSCAEEQAGIAKKRSRGKK